MLLELALENYAVVDRLRAQFHAGLNLLTGETGSGKSIVVDALGLLLGARASSDMIRSGETRARITGRFELTQSPALHALLEPAGIELEDGELLIEREILASGKSRAYVGSRPVSAALLKDLAPHLGDIHGQHDQQLLYVADAQLAMLDAHARAAELLSEVRDLYRNWRAVGAELAAIESTEQEKLRLLDLWTFQRKEIESAALHSGEDVALEEERRVQHNIGRLLENSGAAFAALYDAPESAYALARVAAKRLDDLSRIDTGLAEIRQTLEPAIIAIQEASYALRDYLGHLEANPARLEEVETRLAAIEKLKRKYGGTVEQILEFANTVRAQIEAVENAGETMDRLKRKRDAIARDYEAAAGKLTRTREKAAATLAKAVEKELASLAMERTVFRIAIEPAPWSDAGRDAVRFLVSPNVGEEPRPLDKIASGGEISRIALALKTCLVGADPNHGPARTLVFDEIDTGIGGSAAEGVARRLRKLAAANQVLCVTHLAQIACFADHHYRVEKSESAGRTVTRMEELSNDARRTEIARMLSGHKLTPEAVKHADQLIKAAAHT